MVTYVQLSLEEAIDHSLELFQSSALLWCPIHGKGFSQEVVVWHSYKGLSQINRLTIQTKSLLLLMIMHS